MKQNTFKWKGETKRVGIHVAGSAHCFSKGNEDGVSCRGLGRE
jgi:hypothetical protein